MAMESETVAGKYCKVHSFSDGLAVVRSIHERKWGFIDETGNEVIPCKYDSANSFSDGIAVVGISEWDRYKQDFESYEQFDCHIGERFIKWGCIDKFGKEIVPCKYLFFHDFSDGLALVAFGEIKPVGVRHITMGYMEVEYYDNYKYGFVDKSGKEVIPCIYDYAADFSNGRAMIRLGDKEGFIDKMGNETFPNK
jgi:hypothetical protein